MNPRFDIELLKDAVEFLESLDPIVRRKIIYNIDKSRYVRDANIFKKLDPEVWEFRTRYSGKSYRILAFWERRDSLRPLIVLTHGILKKDMRIKMAEIEKAKSIKERYEQSR